MTKEPFKLYVHRITLMGKSMTQCFPDRCNILAVQFFIVKFMINQYNVVVNNNRF